MGQNLDYVKRWDADLPQQIQNTREDTEPDISQCTSTIETAVYRTLRTVVREDGG